MLFRSPHRVRPVVTSPEEAAGVLQGAVAHMERRYRLMSQVGARNLEQYNAKVGPEEALPYLVIVVDELADLMMTAPKEVEAAILRLAQMARAAWATASSPEPQRRFTVQPATSTGKPASSRASSDSASVQ